VTLDTNKVQVPASDVRVAGDFDGDGKADLASMATGYRGMVHHSKRRIPRYPSPNSGD
jgi:FG-GAP repeat